jgi:hypothetical protein
MKTKALFLISLFVACGLFVLPVPNSNAQGDVTKLGWPAPITENLNGKVQKVVFMLHWCKGEGNDITKGKRITTKELDSLGWFYSFEADFDKAGDFVIKFYSLDDNNKPFETYQCIKENNRITRTNWTLGKDQNIMGINYQKGNGYTKHIYDSRGFLISKDDYKAAGDELLGKFPMKNNEHGDQIECQALDREGNVMTKWTTTYNEKRQITGGSWYGKDGVLTGSSKVKYNDKDKVSEVENYDIDGKLANIIHYRYPAYDAKGNWTSLICTTSNGQKAYCEMALTYFK